MYELTIEPIGETIEVDEGQTMLDAALRKGIWLPHACCHGLCATCKVDVTEGLYEHNDASPFALLDYEREEGKTLACCATMESDCTIEADIEEDPDAEVIPVEDYRGRLSRIEDLTPTIKGLFIKLDRPMQFQAGQYINIELPDEDGEDVVHRAFSLANAPSTGDEIELNVRIVAGGYGTGYIHEKLGEGDEISLSGPYGRFFVRKSADMPMIFFAGGSGLSSPKSMIDELLEEGCEQPITLIYGQRTRDELYYHDEFVELAKKYENFTYVPALSDEPEDSDWTGFRGFVHDAAKDHFGDKFSGHKAYLCGPPKMIDASITALMQGRLFEKDIYLEKFVSAADADQISSPLFKKI